MTAEARCVPRCPESSVAWCHLWCGAGLRLASFLQARHRDSSKAQSHPCPVLGPRAPRPGRPAGSVGHGRARPAWAPAPPLACSSEARPGPRQPLHAGPAAGEQVGSTQQSGAQGAERPHTRNLTLSAVPNGGGRHASEFLRNCAKKCQEAGGLCAPLPGTLRAPRGTFHRQSHGHPTTLPQIPKCQHSFVATHTNLGAILQAIVFRFTSATQ